MIKNKIFFLFGIIFLITSCADTWDSVKRGMTGKKGNSADEFLVEKKDPLVLPPNYDQLPTPDDRIVAAQQISIFEKSVTDSTSTESFSSSSSSSEDSILKKIRQK